MNSEKSNSKVSLKKATIEMLLLKLLSEEDMYGYQLSQELKKRSLEKYVILEGSMYPILYRLTEKKYISFYEKKVGKRQTRVYYHLEDIGKEYYEEMRNDYEKYVKLINFLLSSKGGEVYEEQGV